MSNMSREHQIEMAIRVISDENTAEMAEFLATSTAPTPPGPRQTPIALMDVPGCLRGRGRGAAGGGYDGFGCHGVTFWQFVFEISRVLSKKSQIA